MRKKFARAKEWQGTRHVLQHTGNANQMTSGALEPHRNFVYPKKRNVMVTWTVGMAETKRDARIIW